ncbi:GNAT family N-acetyltransferase [Paenibacillus solisilvae]|uniref:GNAT family N-acetyltransferase n=1 Tax=Paenibacillus solisilvae TaxID=2486751 RepID=A0ABW0W8W3_9BACL
MQLSFETERLILRPFNHTDASEVQLLAGNIEVAKTTLSLPHPYPDGSAEVWIDFRRDAARQGHGYTFAITNKESKLLLGSISLNITSEHKRAELGYWLGVPYWRKGYTTEAAARIIQFGFEELKLNKIFAAALTRNPASSKVMIKIGMKHEGLLRQHVLKWGQPEDVTYYGLTRDDYDRL